MKRIFVLALFVGVASLIADAARAAVVVNVRQVGADVVMTGSGSLDLTTAGAPVAAAGSAEVAADRVAIGAAPPSFLYGGTNNFIGPASIPANSAAASSSSGNLIGLFFGGSARNNFSSPSPTPISGPISGSATYANQSFASLGLANGTYTWSWDTLTGTDYFQMNVGVAKPRATMVVGVNTTPDDGAFDELSETITAAGVTFSLQGGSLDPNVQTPPTEFAVSNNGLGLNPDNNGFHGPEISGGSLKQAVNVGVDADLIITQIQLSGVGNFVAGGILTLNGDFLPFNGSQADENDLLVLDVSSLETNLINVNAGIGEFNIRSVAVAAKPGSTGAVPEANSLLCYGLLTACAAIWWRANARQFRKRTSEHQA